MGSVVTHHGRAEKAWNLARRRRLERPGGISPGNVAAVFATQDAIDYHVVQSGATLSRIAREFYGDARAASWQRIYEANRDAIGDDPGRLRVGMTLQIPQ